MYFIALHESGVTEWKKERAMSEEKQKKWPNERMSFWMHDGSHISLERDANGDLSDAGQAIVDAELRWRKENPSETSGFERMQKLSPEEEKRDKEIRDMLSIGIPYDRLEIQKYLANKERKRRKEEHGDA